MSSACQGQGEFARKEHRAVAAVEALEQRRMLAATPSVVSFVDTDGDNVTVQLTGGGTVEVRPTTRDVELTGTGVQSVLSITVQRAVGGNGLATLGEIRCDGPMLTITAPNADINHEISINDTNEPVSPANKVSMSLGALRNLAMYTGGQRIGTLTVADWSILSTGQELHAPTMDTLIVTGRSDVAGTAANEALPGNCGAILYLGDETTTASDWSAGRIQVAGMLGDLQATGHVDMIFAGQISGQVMASSYGRIATKMVPGSAMATGAITGDILATGDPGVTRAIRIMSITADVTNLTVFADSGDIGQIRVAGSALGLSVRSGGGITSMSVVDELGASRIQSQGSIGDLTVGALSDVTIQVGVAPTFRGRARLSTRFADANATLTRLFITGISTQPAGEPMVSGANTLSAPHIGRIVLRGIESLGAMQIYVANTLSPSVVRDNEIDPTGSFLWHNGDPEPQKLVGMLHWV